ncbi:MAG: MipA/OmpV family protein [Beijerinckiaceae bacterium]|nr:MipA/OmpV family protein [Brevundimonas sp.]MCZ8302039.1 MipA/OmpV family protein [Beijerinckiaceae bacterium]
MIARSKSHPVSQTALSTNFRFDPSGIRLQIPNGIRPRFPAPTKLNALILLTGTTLCGMLALNAPTWAADLKKASRPQTVEPVVKDWRPLSWIEGNWTVTLGAQGNMTPSFEGSDRLLFSPVPIFGIRRTGTPAAFRAPDDGFGLPVFSTNNFKIGVAGRLKPARDGSEKATRGLGDVDLAVEAGLFAEYWATEWLRVRSEVRRGLTGHEGLVGDIGADVVLKPLAPLTLSIGPRLAWGDNEYMSTYFGVNAQQSAGSGLSQYKAQAGIRSIGVTASASYRATEKITLTGFAKFDRLVGDAAAAPLVKGPNGSQNQFAAGLGISYAFDFSIRR